MRPEHLADEVLSLLRHSPSLPGMPIRAELIANPSAGGFTRPRVTALREAELAELRSRFEAMAPRPEGAELRLHLTGRAGHATEIARTVFAEHRESGEKAFRILMTAGGDGTSLESLEALMELPDEERSRWAVLRLPLGTGNDGSEGRDLVACLGRLLGPARIGERRGIICSPASRGGKAPSWAFNIASIGFDAYVTHMTNRLKTSFPGDSYKLWVDLASVFYDRIFKVAPLELSAFDAEEAEVRHFTRPCMLVAFGVSGHRQYGSNKPILPDEDNVCAVFQMPFFRKLALKGPISSGHQRGLPEASLFSAERLVFDYHEKILMQRDGEALELGPEDFPLSFALSSARYRIVETA